jgi:neutral ceramidase
MNGAILSLLLLGVVAGPTDFQAGAARKSITPDGPVWMGGFADRDHVSEGVLHDLWAKALALRDSNGERLVIVAIDLVSVSRDITEEAAERIKKKCGMERRQLLFNVSHTHCGPLVWGKLESMFRGTPEQRQKLIEYRNALVDKLVEVVVAAQAELKPATLAVGRGTAGFAANRRPWTKGDHPVDHDVPVLKIASPEGRLIAVLFGYCCHNTSLLGDCYAINGDYAGFAQIELEKSLPGATAMFFQLCGADQNAHPRGKLELTEKYGRQLAATVSKALAKATPVRPSLGVAYEDAILEFARKDRSVFEQEARSGDRYQRLRAEALLAALDAGKDIWRLPVPVQAVRFADNLAMIAIGGEVVVDYSLRLKREYPNTNLIVAGYSNDVMCYIPSRRVLREGGYEGESAMVYYRQPGAFADNVEDRVVAACRRVLDRVGVKSQNASIDGINAPRNEKEE